MRLRVVNFVLVTALLAIAVTTGQETFKVKDSATKKGTVSSHHRELSFRQRHQLGLTISAVRDSYKSLKESGEVNEDTSDSEVSATIALDISRKNQQAFSAQANLDWEAIIAWIEKILELLKLFM